MKNKYNKNKGYIINKKLRVAINGFGRIGRNVLRALLERQITNYSKSETEVLDDFSAIEIVAINDIAENISLIHLLNYDSTHGRLTALGFHAKLESDNTLVIYSCNKENEAAICVIDLYSEREPSSLPWKELNIDIVLESSGMFRSYEGAKNHLLAGAQQVIIGAAPFDNVDACIVMGVNDYLLQKTLKIISSVSCTTQALVPLIHVLDNVFGVESAMMTEIHAVTADQNVLDQGHRDLRRSRASGYNIIPTTSSSINATTRVLPQMRGRINGHSIRVPTINVASIDVTFTFKTAVTLDEIRQCLEDAAAYQLKGVMGFTDLPLVSSDFLHQTESLIVDGQQLMQVGQQFKVFAWYDNEWGYANRLLEMCAILYNKT